METISLEVLRRAIETRDGAALGGCYADDAVLLIIDQLNPPKQPREIRGHAAVAAYFDDVCGRTMTHKVENGIETADRMAFTQVCRYPDGKGVFCSTTIELARGKIHLQHRAAYLDLPRIGHIGVRARPAPLRVSGKTHPSRQQQRARRRARASHPDRSQVHLSC